MKNLIVIACVILLSIGINAQTQQGKVFFSGFSKINASFLTSNAKYDGQQVSDQYKETNFKIEPAFGYFLMNNFAFGVATSFDHKNQKQGDIEASTNTIVFGPFIRTYFGQSSCKPFAEAGFGFASSKYTESGYQDTKMNGSEYQLGIGVGYFINEKISLDGIIEYQGLTLKEKDDTKFVETTGGINIGIGFTVCF